MMNEIPFSTPKKTTPCFSTILLCKHHSFWEHFPNPLNRHGSFRIPSQLWFCLLQYGFIPRPEAEPRMLFEKDPQEQAVFSRRETYSLVFRGEVYEYISLKEEDLIRKFFVMRIFFSGEKSSSKMAFSSPFLQKKLVF